MDDIMISFEFNTREYLLDYSKDNSGVYTNEGTRIAYFWYRKGFLQGEKG